MPIYVCKHYRRSAPGAKTGTVVNELRFEADSAAQAETRMRQSFRSPKMPPMDWDKDFATLETDSGHVLVTWLHGFLHG
jgi:hypothetical protein